MGQSQEYSPEISDGTSKRVSNIRSQISAEVKVQENALLHRFGVNGRVDTEKPYTSTFAYSAKGLFGRRTKVETQWLRKKELGSSAFGKMWLEEKCQDGTTRAVKQLKKTAMRYADIDYTKELITWARLANVRI